MPQVTTENADNRSSFKLAGGVPFTGAPPFPLAAQYEEGPLSPAEQFHYRLRELERARTWGPPAGAPSAGAAPRRVVTLGPGADTVGNRRVFKVLSSLTSFVLTTVNVVAFAKSVGQHVAIYVDSTAPAAGLTQADLDTLRSVFDTLLYPVDTAAFGRESDIDNNGLVLVLMSSVVNKLVTAQACSTSFIAGFFFGADIDPAAAAQWNNGELFYSLVADSGATLSCSHPNSQIKRLVPVTFIHEFQHMISYNQHVLVRSAPAEVLWLNEGMSHYAEELGGRAFLAGTGGTDSLHFCHHVRGDLNNLAMDWVNPGPYALIDTSGIGGLPERGAFWLFVRYLVDRFATDTTIPASAAFTRQLVQTSATGTQNVTQVTGQPYAKSVEEWALANWVSDLPGFTPPAALTYKHWAFRSDYPALYAKCASLLIPTSFPNAFPLVAVSSAGRSVSLTGTMWSGSGAAYQRALQGPSEAGYTLLFSDRTGAQLLPILAPRLNVLRIR